MALHLSVNEDKTKFRFWSTIVDKYLSPWLSRDEALVFIRARKQAQLEVEMREETENFPLNWFDKDTYKLL